MTTINFFNIEPRSESIMFVRENTMITWSFDEVSAGQGVSYKLRSPLKREDSTTIKDYDSASQSLGPCAIRDLLMFPVFLR